MTKWLASAVRWWSSAPGGERVAYEKMAEEWQ
jgi:hypothetical protein